MNKVIPLSLVSIFISILSITVSIASPYIPQITNYSVSEYKAGNQNWAVAQGADGKIYLGNNRGLLVFDGVRWTLYKLENDTPIRSLYISKDQRIYVGSFEEFGYFQENTEGRLTYHSLKKLVTDYQFFNDEIWTILEFHGKIYFQSFSSYFIYDGTQVSKGKTDLHPLYFFTVNDHLYAQFIDLGFYRFEDGIFTEIISRSHLNDNVVAALPHNKGLLLVTAMNGLYLYQDGYLTPWEDTRGLLMSNIANRAIMMPDSTYIIGTITDGVTAIDKNGQQLWHINHDTDLINNCVLGLHADTSGNLWVALDNGISYIQVNSPLYFYNPQETHIGMVYDLTIKNKDIYLATNQGIYLLTDQDSQLRLIPGTEEQTWFITDVGNQLIAGHNQGTLILKDRKPTRIPGPTGGGTALRKSIIHGKEVLVQTSYTSISIFVQNTKGDWEFSHNVEGFSNLVKSLEIDPAGNIWASHMHKGLYRISLEENLRKIKDIEYIGRLDSNKQDGKINIMKLRGRIVLTDGTLFYTYEDLSNTIVPYDLLNTDFPELGDTYRIISLNNDTFWFIRNTEYVLLSYEAGRFLPRLRIPFSLFENPTIEDRGNIFINSKGDSYFCLNGGIALYTPSRAVKSRTDIPLSLSSIKVHNRHNNKSYFLPNKEADVISTGISVDYQFNNITFELSYPDYAKQYTRVLYKLDGFDNEWSEETSDFFKNYSNLPYGQYTFLAVVEDSSGNSSSSISYPFIVKRPFYRSTIALILYIILVLLIIGFLIKAYINREINRENKEREAYRQKQKEQLKAQEQLIIQLKNEQLETELTYKSKELASVTLARISQNDFLEELKKELQAQQISGSYSKRFFEKVIHLINNNLTKEDEWVLYQNNFDRIHEKFFVKLKEQYPDLTPGDLRMCALLRLNMPTKDMASMLNLSVRGIEAARYRLRKKLNLSEGESLVDFMIRFS